MKSASLVLFVGAVLLAAAIGVRSEATDAHANDGVEELSVEAFRKEVAKARPLLVNFYTSWCKHCKDAAPAYAELASMVKARTDLDVKVAKMNVEKNPKKDLAEEVGVHAYPTIRMYQNGKHSEYERERSAEVMLRWVERKVGMGVQDLASREEVDKLIASAEMVIIGFFEKRQSPAAKVFVEAAKELDDVVFGMITKKDLMQAFNVDEGTMSVFKKFDEPRVDYPLVATPSSIRRIVQAASRPLLSEFGVTDTAALFNPKLNANRTMLAVFLSRKAGHFDQYSEMLRALAIENRNCTFMTVNADVETSQPIFEVFEVKNTSVPAMRMLDFSAVQKFRPLMDKIHPDAIRAFIHGVNSGAIKPADGDHEAPEGWDAGAVKVLVGSTFESFVFDGRRHTVVFFFNEFCPSCAAVSPIIEELAEMYDDQTALAFAKINVRRNKIDDKAAMSIKGVPTIAVYPKSKKDSPAVFAGDESTIENLVGFVKKHTGLKPSSVRSKDTKNSSAKKEEL